MRKHDFGYFFREGVSNLFSHGFRTFAAITTAVACLLIMGTFTLVAVNVNALLEDLEQENEIVVYVEDTYTTEEAAGIRGELEAVPNVTSANFIDREQATQDFAARYPEEALFQNLDPQIFRDRYVIKIADLEVMSHTVGLLEKVEGVAEVSAEEEIAGGFIAARNIATAVCLSLIAILFVVTVFIISNTIKLTTFDRREEIAIMRMVGATSSFIRGPFVVEGLILGTIGSATAYLAQWGLYSLVEKSLVGSGGLSFIRVIDFSVLAIPMLIVFVGVGFAVGAMGSSMAIKNYLKV